MVLILYLSVFFGIGFLRPRISTVIWTTVIWSWLVVLGGGSPREIIVGAFMTAFMVGLGGATRHAFAPSGAA